MKYHFALFLSFNVLFCLGQDVYSEPRYNNELYDIIAYCINDALDIVDNPQDYWLITRDFPTAFFPHEKLKTKKYLASDDFKRYKKCYQSELKKNVNALRIAYVSLNGNELKLKIEFVNTNLKSLSYLIYDWVCYNYKYDIDSNSWKLISKQSHGGNH